MPKERRSSKEMMNYWKRCDQGRYSLVHNLSTPERNVHTARAVPQVIKDLENADNPSLCTLAEWVHEYYETNHLNIRQITDGDLLQVFNAIFISGLLQQLGYKPEVVQIQDSDSDSPMDSDNEEEKSHTSDSYSGNNRYDNREIDSEEEDSSDPK